MVKGQVHESIFRISYISHVIPVPGTAIPASLMAGLRLMSNSYNGDIFGDWVFTVYLSNWNLWEEGVNRFK